MTVEEIHKQLEKYHSKGKRLFITSSFQTHSIPLLHVISRSRVDIDVMFINTGFHFPESINFRNEVVDLLGLNLVDVKPLITKTHQKDEYGQFYFVSDPDYCCYLNKTQPLEPYLMKYDIWVNGIRADQSSIREGMKMEEKTLFDTIRFHPFLKWSREMIEDYRKKHELPSHPLDAKGYKSIGCVPCTRSSILESERDARWYGMSKTECGLHTELIVKPE